MILLSVSLSIAVAVLYAVDDAAARAAPNECAGERYGGIRLMRRYEARALR